MHQEKKNDHIQGNPHEISGFLSTNLTGQGRVCGIYSEGKALNQEYFLQQICPSERQQDKDVASQIKTEGFFFLNL